MALNTEAIVKFWRGNRATYNALGTYDYWTRYTVIEDDGRRTEYFGTVPVTITTGELYPVRSVLTTTEFASVSGSMAIGDRYLVGQDGTYYVVEKTAGNQQYKIEPLGVHEVRVEDRKLYSYQLVNGNLVSYDHIIDCGTF